MHSLLSIESCIFRNLSSNQASVIFLDSGSELSINSSSFSNIWTDSRRGAGLFFVGNSAINITNCNILNMEEQFIIDDFDPINLTLFNVFYLVAEGYLLSDFLVITSEKSLIHIEHCKFSSPVDLMLQSFLRTRSSFPKLIINGTSFSRNILFSVLLSLDHSGFSLQLLNMDSRKMFLNYKRLLEVYAFKSIAPKKSEITISQCLFWLTEMQSLASSFVRLNSATDLSIKNCQFFFSAEFNSVFIESTSLSINTLFSRISIDASRFLSIGEAQTDVKKYKLTEFIKTDEHCSEVGLFDSYFKLGIAMFTNILRAKGLQNLTLKGNTILGNAFQLSSQCVGLFGIASTYIANKKLMISITDNHLNYNRMFSGGVLSLDFSANANQTFDLQFTGNQVISNLVTMKGGVFYVKNFAESVGDNNQSQIQRTLNLTENEFINNHATHGPLLFEEANDPTQDLLDISEIHRKNIVRLNKPSESTGEQGSSIKYSVFSTQQKENIDLATYGDNILKSMRIEKTVTNFEVKEDCFFFISFMDKRGDLVKIDTLFETINYTFPGASEPFLLTQGEVNIVFELKKGSLCAKQIFLKKNVRFDYSYSVIFDRPVIFAAFGNLEKKTNPKLTLSFRIARCQRGSYMSGEDFQCKSCPINSYSNDDNLLSVSTCIFCSDMENFYCYGGDLRSPRPKFWRSAENSSYFLRCPRTDSCRGDLDFPSNLTNTDCVNCSLFGVLRAEANYEYHPNFTYSGSCKIGYRGALCAECDKPLFGMSENFLCSLCENNNVYIKEALIIVFKTLLLLFTVWKSITMNEELVHFNGEISGSFKENTMASFLLKILFQHIQVLMIIKCLPIEMNINFDNFLSVFFETTSPNFSTAYSSECLLTKLGFEIEPVYFRTYFLLVFNGILFLLIGMFLIVRNYKNYDQNSDDISRFFFVDNIKISLKMASLALLMTNYVGQVEPFLDLFVCIQLGDPLVPSTKKIKLLKDLTIECYQPTHLKYLLVLGVPGLLLMAVCLPGYIFFKIYKGKKADSLNHKSNLGLLGFFYFPYREEVAYFEIFIICRKVLFVVIKVLFVYFVILEQAETITFVLAVVLFASYLQQVVYDPYKTDSFYELQKIECHSLLVSISNAMVALIWQLSAKTGSNLQTYLFLTYLVITNTYFFVFWTYSYYVSQYKKFKQTMTIVARKLSMLSRRRTSMKGLLDRKDFNPNLLNSPFRSNENFPKSDKFADMLKINKLLKPLTRQKNLERTRRQNKTENMEPNSKHFNMPQISVKGSSPKSMRLPGNTLTKISVQAIGNAEREVSLEILIEVVKAKGEAFKITSPLIRGDWVIVNFTEETESKASSNKTKQILKAGAMFLGKIPGEISNQHLFVPFELTFRKKAITISEKKFFYNLEVQLLDFLKIQDAVISQCTDKELDGRSSSEFIRVEIVAADPEQMTKTKSFFGTRKSEENKLNKARFIFSTPFKLTKTLEVDAYFKEDGQTTLLVPRIGEEALGCELAPVIKGKVEKFIFS